MNEYCGLQTLKAFMPGNGIVTAEYDDVLMSLNEAVSRTIDGSCGRHFYTVQSTRVLDGVYGDELWIGDDIVSLTALGVDANGDGVYEYTLVVNDDYWLYPDNIYPKRRIDLNTMGQLASYGRGRRRVRATGVFGYEVSTRSGGTLGAAIATTTTTTVTMAVGHSIQRGHTIVIGTEQLYVSDVDANTLTVVRGVNGTTAVTALSAAAVSITTYPAPVELAVKMQISRLYKRRESAFANVLNSTDFGTLTVFRGIDPDIEEMLRPYRVGIPAVA